MPVTSCSDLLAPSSASDDTRIRPEELPWTAKPKTNPTAADVAACRSEPPAPVFATGQLGFQRPQRRDQLVSSSTGNLAIRQKPILLSGKDASAWKDPSGDYLATSCAPAEWPAFYRGPAAIDSLPSSITRQPSIDTGSTGPAPEATTATGPGGTMPRRARAVEAPTSSLSVRCYFNVSRETSTNAGADQYPAGPHLDGVFA
jgi:hypothetical protein